MRATFDIPEQGVKDWEAKDVMLDDGQFSVELPKTYAKVTGLLKGNQIVGQWNLLGNLVPLTLTKGKIRGADELPPLPGRGACAARRTLEGHAQMVLAVVVRFETDAQGRTLGFFDSTQQGLLNIPITQAELAGTKLTFAMAAGMKFTGETRGRQADGRMDPARARQTVAARAHA